MQSFWRDESAGKKFVLMLAALGFCCLIVFLYALSWNSRYAGFLSDDAVYLLMADGFSPYRHAASGLFAYVMRQSLFPPFYPMLLAAFGGGSAALLVSHWITTTTLVLSLLVYASWIRAETGSRLQAISLAAIFGFLPGILLHNLELLSEFPYLLLSLLALRIASAQDTGTQSRLMLALCIGLAAVTRSAGLSLVLALAIWLFLHRTKGSFRWIALAVLPNALWMFYKALKIGGHAGYGSLWLGLWEQVRHDGLFGFIWHFLAGQSAALWFGFLANFDFRPSLPSVLVTASVLLLAVPVWIRRLWVKKLDAWYLLIGVGMIVLYPFPGFFTRLVLPWIPIVLLYGYLGIGTIAERCSGRAAGYALNYGFLVALSFTTLPSSGFMVQRFFTPIDSALAGWKHTRYWFRFESIGQIKSDLIFRQNLVDATRELPNWVPEGQCVYGTYTAMPMLYSQRIFEQPPVSPDMAAKYDPIPEACRYYLLVSASGDIAGRPVKAFYPYERLPANRVQVLHIWKDKATPGVPSAILLALKPSA